MTRLPPQLYTLSAAGHFHPGTAHLDGATAVDLAPAQRVVLPDFVLPAATLTVEGTVREADGRPGEGAVVHVMTRGGQRIAGRSVPTGADGTFRIAATPGASYEAVAEHGHAQQLRTARSDPFDLSSDVTGLELQLPERRSSASERK